MKHFEAQKDRMGQAAVFGLLGTLHFEQEKYLKSIDFFERALEIYDELNLYKEKIYCLKFMGNAWAKMEEHDKAEDLLFECSNLCSEHDDIYNLLDCLGSLVNIHENQENWDVLMELYQKILEAFEQLRDKRGIITTYFNLGIISKKLSDFERASRYFKQGTNVAIDANYAELIIKGLGYVGEALFHLGEIKKAKDQYIKALNLAQKVKAKNAIPQIKILLRSLGLSDANIQEELEKIRQDGKD